MEHRDPKTRPSIASTAQPAKRPVDGSVALVPATLVSENDELRVQPLDDAMVKANKPVALPAVKQPVVQATVVSRHVSNTQNVANPVLLPAIDASPIPWRRKLLWTAAPSWLISLFVHVTLILILAAVTLDPMERVLSILKAGSSELDETIEQFDLQGPQLDAPQSLDDPLAVPQTEISDVVSMPELSTSMLPVVDTSVNVIDSNRLTESIMPSALLSGGALSQLTTSLNSRSAASKSEMLERFGGNAASEKAVAMALKWISDHQAPNGGWTFAHSEICRGQCDGQGDLALATNAATAMALLPFLGAGQTHLEGQYKETVHKGLAFLINRMKVTSGALPEGSWHEPGGRMYSHGLAAITICEAYAMTRDPDLLQPAQLSLNYLIA